MNFLQSHPNGVPELLILALVIIVVYVIVKLISPAPFKINQEILNIKSNSFEYRSKSDFQYYSELSSADLKEFISEYKSLTLSQLKEILYILHIRESYTINSLPLLSQLMTHFGLTRSGELISTKEEIVQYKIVELTTSRKVVDSNGSQMLVNLKMLHGGNLISNAGRYLFVSNILTISVLVLIVIFSSVIRFNPENYTQDSVAGILIVSGIFLLVSIILQLKGYSSLHNAGEIFKTPE